MDNSVVEKNAELAKLCHRIANIFITCAEGILRVDLADGWSSYHTITASPFLLDVFGESGDMNTLLANILAGKDQLGGLQQYKAFFYERSVFDSFYSRYIDLESNGKTQRLMASFLRESKQTVYVLFTPAQDAFSEEDMSMTKNRALNQNFLYSMLVDLDENACYNIHVSEIALSGQDNVKMDFSSWRRGLTPCIQQNFLPVFQRHTDPDFIGRKLRQNNRYSYYIQMSTLSKTSIWTRHSLLRVQDQKNNHLLFVYMVEEINDEIISLLPDLHINPVDIASIDNGQISSALTKSPSHLSSLSNLILEQIELEIQSNYMAKLTLKDLAHKYYINTAYLGQLFIKKFGKSFHEYLSDVRMTQAGLLLQNTDLPIRSIFDMVGVSSSNYFNRLFKNHYGCSPTEYRKSYCLNLSSDCAPIYTSET